MIEQWQELKETITEMRDNDGTGTQQEVCKFLVNYMGVLEKQMQEPCDVFDEYGNYKYPSDFELTEPNTATSMPCGDAISRQAVLDIVDSYSESQSNVEDVTQDIISDIVVLPLVNPQPKTGHCKDCKWWKDSDGLYRRGIHAESQCPINSIEVYEGNGYCYMFEPQERSE